MRYTAAAGFFSGVTETEFAPQREITRAMLVTLLWRMENRPVVNYLMSFYDVSPDAYYGEAVRWAVSEGIVKGYSDTVFSPDRAVSRQEIAVIFQRYAQYKEMEAEKSGDLNQFADSAQASEWAEEGLSWAIGAVSFREKETAVWILWGILRVLKRRRYFRDFLKRRSELNKSQFSVIGKNS